MTKERQTASEDGQELGADVIEVRETATVQERLVKRTCEWCGKAIEWSGVGRPPLYCRDAHRKRASALRRAQALADRPVAEGGRTAEPVREVVERTRTVTQTVVRQGPVEVRRVPATRLSGEPYTMPADPIEWAEALAHLRDAVSSGRIPAPARESLARACDQTARALRADVA